MSYQPKSNRKFYATALTTAVVASAVAPAAVSADHHEFSDVKDGEYYSEAIQQLADQGILQGSGDGTFNPDGDIIRASAAEVLMKAKGITPGGTEDFSDVDEDDWFYNAVRSTSPAIFEGDNGEFSPYDNLTREQAAAIIVRAYELTGDTDHNFSDVEEGSWSEDEIAVAAENGIIKGNGSGEFMPKDNVTRKDFAVMVYRAMQNEEQLSIESTSVVDAMTLEVTWSNGETTTVELDEALVNGENTVTFDVDGVDYTVTVDYDAVAPAVEAAEKAIEELPEELTLEDAEAVEMARELVEAVYEMDEDADIEGLETLVTAEETIEALEAEAAAIAEATEAVETAEETLLEEDLADAQELVDELSDSDAKVLLNARLVNVQDQLDSIIEAVNDAEGELETFRALDVKPFMDVNEDYISAYVTALEENEPTDDEDNKLGYDSVESIQSVIDDVNKAMLDAEVEADLNAATEAVQALETLEDQVNEGSYNTDNFDEEDFAEMVEKAQKAIDELPADYKVNEDDDQTAAQDLQERLDDAVEVVENYVNVVEPVLSAKTQVELFNLLTADFENVNEDNIEDYETALEGSVTVDETDYDVDTITVEDLQYVVDFVNAQNTVEDFTVDAETTQEDLDALKELVPMTGEEDDDDNATATPAEQALLDVVKGYQTSFENLETATKEFSEAVTAAEDALEAYLDAGGSEEDDLYTAVEDQLEVAEDVDYDSVGALTDVTSDLTEATTALEAATESSVSLNEAVAEAEAAQEAYLAAGGDEDSDLYKAVTAALDADTQVEADIEEATKALVAETEELELVSSINDAETAEDLAAALVNLENGSFNNLSGVQRLEVAEWFLADLEDMEDDYTSSENISNALTKVITNDVDTDERGYLELIKDVNDAESITETDQALEALNIEEYEALSAAEQLAVAENVLDARPDYVDGDDDKEGYTSISSIVANF